MKPFDLEKAKAGAPLCAREGFRARIVCFDANNDKFPIVALLEGDDGKGYPVSFTKKGRFSDGEKDTPDDLFMVGEKKEGWINIYEASKERCIGAVYNSKETAMRMKVNEKDITCITTVRVEWKKDFTAFYNWSMDNGYSKELSIDRINHNGNYEPSNCRWATPKEQSDNKRCNILITINGTTLDLQQWCDKIGIKRSTVNTRVRMCGWTYEKALSTPVRKHKEYKVR